MIWIGVAIGAGAVPDAAFTRTPQTCVGIPVSFSNQSSGTPISWQWDFGDGSTGTGVNPVHTYAEDGAYTVTLCIRDDDLLPSCCEGMEPVVSTLRFSWSTLKQLYR